jgi:hypothetical protein
MFWLFLKAISIYRLLLKIGNSHGHHAGITDDRDLQFTNAESPPTA